jgi:hypothetical protein
MTRPPNYDIDLLQFVQWRPGFIWGEAIWGVSAWGVDTVLTSINKAFTSLVIDQPCVVEQGMFVHTEPPTATLTTTDPDHLTLRGQRLQILYNGQELFYGTVADVSMVEEVDAGRPDRRGNTMLRTHRITLRLQQGAEAWATSPTPPRNFTSQSFADRLQSWLGTTSAGADTLGDEDVDSGVMENVSQGIADEEVVLTTDDRGTLLDSIRGTLGRINRVARPFLGMGHVDTESISRCMTTSLVATTLRFTDTPLFGVAHISYTSRTLSENSQLFPTGVAVTISGVRYGPYDCAAQQRVAEVDLGDVNYSVSGRDPQTARNFAATCPLQRTPRPFTSKITAPAQPDLFTVFPVPRLAMLHRDGVEEQIAVIGVTQTITPTGWLLDFECAPPHLLTRQSDLDPSPVTALSVTQPGGAGTNVFVEWRSPKNMPTDVPIYFVIFSRTSSPFPGGVLSSDITSGLQIFELATQAPGTLMSRQIGLSAGFKWVYVLYTSDSLPGGAFNDSFRQGQGRFKTIVVA